MIRYKLTTPDGEVVVALDSEQPNKVAPIAYQGTPNGVMVVKRWLHYETGAYGHQIGDWTAPIDLKAAMRKPSAKRFSPELIEEVLGVAARSKTDGEGGG
jgi:hypothetical protein